MTSRRRLLPVLLAATALAGALSGALATPAFAQQDDRRLADLQRQVRELRAIVFQGRDTGQPVEVKPVGPDPQVVALQSRVDGMAEQQRQLVGQNEVLQHDLDETRRTAENNRAEAGAFRAAAEARIARLEAQLAAAAPPPAGPDAVAAAPAPVSLPPVALPPSNRPPASRRAQELTARTQANDTSRFGEPASAATATDPFADAYARWEAADYAGAQSGFEGYIAANPSGVRTPEARYWLGQTLFARASYGPAARAYAESLKGWPKSKWAPDATVRLAQSLAELNQPANACAAVAEFSRRYAVAAPPAVRTRATAVRTRAQCPA